MLKTVCPAARCMHGSCTIPPRFMNKTTILLLLLSCAAASLGSCVPLAVGAAAGYVAHDQGYRVRNPVTKE